LARWWRSCSCCAALDRPGRDLFKERATLDQNYDLGHLGASGATFSASI
jgi:hypothetical protein